MKLAAGTNAYSVSAPPIKGEGILFSQSELDAALEHRLPPLLRDDAGKKAVGEFLGSLATTAFETERLAAILNSDVPIKDWQVGESLAEAYLVDHKECSFPWPTGRDLRNPKASPAGADLVGFQKSGKTSRFAFGEVKTSMENKWPPQVVTSRHGFAKQVEELRDVAQTKNHLVTYLAHRAKNATWQSEYMESAKRYLQDSSDVSLFGFLVRDVAAKKEDIESRATQLAKGCPKLTSVELRAMYFPADSIKNFATKVKKKPSKGSTK